MTDETETSWREEHEEIRRGLGKPWKVHPDEFLDVYEYPPDTEALRVENWLYTHGPMHLSLYVFERHGPPHAFDDPDDLAVNVLAAVDYIRERYNIDAPDPVRHFEDEAPQL
jgi:hypothetical protein